VKGRRDDGRKEEGKKKKEGAVTRNEGPGGV
jgi:hypothetical protein